MTEPDASKHWKRTLILGFAGVLTTVFAMGTADVTATLIIITMFAVPTVGAAYRLHQINSGNERDTKPGVRKAREDDTQRP